jgi:hypothetical protein
MSSNGAGRAGIVRVRLLIVALAAASGLVTGACAEQGSPTPPSITGTPVPPATSSTTPIPTPTAVPLPRRLTALLTGDSVSVHLEDTLATVAHRRLGWRLVSAAVPACSIYGDPLAWTDGTRHGPPHHCPRAVRKTQRFMVRRTDPDVVIWWDRLSTLPFFTEGGAFVHAGTRRFWELRAVAFDETLARLTAGGARVVFVSTEPIGIGVLDLCAGWESRGCRLWRRWRMRQYANITESMNVLMRRYAADHPATAVFISITDSICRRNVSPCDDRMRNEELARPDGTHYREEGEFRAARALIREMRAALQASYAVFRSTG